MTIKTIYTQIPAELHADYMGGIRDGQCLILIDNKVDKEAALHAALADVILGNTYPKPRKDKEHDNALMELIIRATVEELRQFVEQMPGN